MINIATQVLSTQEIILCVLGGGIGALAKDCIKDNTLELPFIHDRKIYLGFIGAVVIGAFIGVAIDGSFFTALMGGYTGSSVLASLVTNGTEIKKARKLQEKKTESSLKVPKSS